MTAVRPMRERGEWPATEPLPPFLVLPPVDWHAVFGPGTPLALEIGPGKGDFLAEMARLYPGTGFVAVEIRRKRVWKVSDRLRREGVTNARILFGDGRTVIPTSFPAGSLSALYVNFPDPWPKRRHAKRRLFQPDFVALAARLLAPGGVLVAGTDSAAYAAEILARVEANPDFRNAFGPGRTVPAIEGYPASIHERKFRAWGRTIRYIKFTRR